MCMMPPVPKGGLTSLRSKMPPSPALEFTAMTTLEYIPSKPKDTRNYRNDDRDKPVSSFSPTSGWSGWTPR